jgi:diacylglycerol kinase (ATP)
MKHSKKSDDISKRRFTHSVNDALEGIVHTLQHERNMRIHFLLAFLVLVLAIFFNFTALEFMMLGFAIALVLVAEMFNTAVEHAIDLISGHYHPLAKIVKDISAGAVFVCAVNAAIVGYLLFLDRIKLGGVNWLDRLRTSPWHITLIALTIVVGIVLVIKILRREKELLRGGLPSGHSAVAFAIWTAVALLTGSPLVVVLTFFLALMIAKSRRGVHTLAEVILGSILGILVVLTLFQLLY